MLRLHGAIVEFARYACANGCDREAEKLPVAVGRVGAKRREGIPKARPSDLAADGRRAVERVGGDYLRNSRRCTKYGASACTLEGTAVVARHCTVCAAIEHGLDG